MTEPSHDATPNDGSLARGINVTGSTPDDRCPPRCDGPLNVRLSPYHAEMSPESALNALIRYQVDAISFPRYKAYIDGVVDGMTRELGDSPQRFFRSLQRFEPAHGTPPTMMAGPDHPPPRLLKIHGTYAYDVLRIATEAFLLTRCGPACADFDDADAFTGAAAEDARRFGTGVDAYRQKVTEYLAQFVGEGKPRDPGTTPYMELIIDQLFQNRPPGDPLARLYRSRYECPDMLELIWSYWHEEGMLSQTMNAIAIRFQNRRSRPGRDPLAALEIDPLRPLNNLLWGWIQSEYRRLSVQRRAYEYDHHYGLTLLGKAVPPLMSADSRSKFLESFHNLLHLAHLYYVERSDTTRVPDGFPLLNGLRALHLILAEGAHNQYGDLPWTSRVEMLIEQWLLARPEMREFLRGRAMVPYQQSWMGQVDTMKKLQGWTDVTVTHFHELATCGEAILLSVRQGPWATSNLQDDAIAWADYWKPEIQRYIYAYKSATGSDLTFAPVDTEMPARRLQGRLAQQRATTMA